MRLCAAQYHDPMRPPLSRATDRVPGVRTALSRRSDSTQIGGAALRAGRIVAVKGIGGYHLACDAQNRDAVHALRERKYRKEKPFAVMVRNIDIARALADLSAEAEALLTSAARPIVLAPAKIDLAGRRAGQCRTGRDAALRSAASSAIRGGRAGMRW